MAEEKEGLTKKSKIVFILLGIFLVIAIVAILIIVLKKPEAPREQVTQPYDEVMDIMRLAIESNDRSICQGIIHSGQRSDCEEYFLDYFLERAETDCVNPKGSDLKAACKYADIISSDDYERCDELSGHPEEYCFITYAVNLNDLKICDNIKDKDVVQICYGIVSKDAKYCDEIGLEKQQVCYALALNDPEFCKEDNDVDLCIGILKGINPFLGRRVFLEEI